MRDPIQSLLFHNVRQNFLSGFKGNCRQKKKLEIENSLSEAHFQQGVLEPSKKFY